MQPSRGIFVRIDMEDSIARRRHARASTASCARRGSTTSASCSRRTSGGRSTTSRRSAIWPERPALQGDLRRAGVRSRSRSRRVRASFVACLDALLDGGCRSAIATHDEWLIEESLGASASGLAARRTSSRCCSASAPSAPTSSWPSGHPLRIYVPFGQEWYEYSLRRLQENPKIAGYVASDTFGRLLASRNGR